MVGLQRHPMKMILNGWCQQWPHSFCFWRCGRTMEISPRMSLPPQAQVYGKVDDKLPPPCNSFSFVGSDAPSRPRTVARKASLISRPAVKEPPLRPIERKKRLAYQEFAEKYDGQRCLSASAAAVTDGLGSRPVIVENVASNWSATKDWSRKRFANAYRNEMLVLTVTQSGLNKREVMVAPVKELNYYAQNASVGRRSSPVSMHRRAGL